MPWPEGERRRTLRLRVRNDGRTRWLAGTRGAGGVVFEVRLLRGASAAAARRRRSETDGRGGHGPAACRPISLPARRPRSSSKCGGRWVRRVCGSSRTCSASRAPRLSGWQRMGGGAVSQSSWIVEMRDRLATPPPMGLATEGIRSGGAGALVRRRRRAVDHVPWAPASWCPARRRSTRPPPPRRGALAGSRAARRRSAPTPRHCSASACSTRCPIRQGMSSFRARRRYRRRLAMTSATSGDTRFVCPYGAARAPSLLEERRVAVRGVETWVTVGRLRTGEARRRRARDHRAAARGRLFRRVGRRARAALSFLFRCLANQSGAVT